jgi:glycerol-3-phosphate dehydrogenase subunit C
VATYDPADPVYWDPGDLDREMDRIFDVCNGCRLCFNLCPTFPAMFEAADAQDTDRPVFSAQVKRHLVDLCYECRLCHDVCPYTPPHRFQLDFPRLVLRARAQRAKAEGIPLSDRLLGDTDRLGRAGTATAALANWGNRQAPVRWAVERVAGVHRRRRLPPFARRTFASWHWAHGRRPGEAPPPATVALFATCLVNYQYPEVGRAATFVLERNGFGCTVAAQRCCGMPALDTGDIARARRLAEANVAELDREVAAGRPVVVPEPTCGYMIKKEYPVLLGTEAARRVAGATRDLGEFLAALDAAGKLDRTFTGPVPARALYHVPCHLKAQNIGLPTRKLLSLLPGLEVEEVDRCSGMDGGWGLRRQNYALSLKVARPLLKRVHDAPDADVLSECSLAGLQILEGTGRRVRHPVELLAEAYGYPEGPVREAESEPKGAAS